MNEERRVCGLSGHSFSWRMGLEICRYCGEAIRPSADVPKHPLNHEGPFSNLPGNASLPDGKAVVAAMEKALEDGPRTYTAKPWIRPGSDIPEKPGWAIYKNGKLVARGEHGPECNCPCCKPEEWTEGSRDDLEPDYEVLGYRETAYAESDPDAVAGLAGVLSRWFASITEK